LIDLRPVAIVACLGGAFLLQGPLGHANAARRVDDYKFLPDAAFLKVVAGAHRSSGADLVWLDALPNISKQFLDEERKRRKRVWLAAVLDTVTDVEPRFTTPYMFGAHYLWLAHQDKQASIALLAKGVQANPTSVELLRQLGMGHYQVGDKEQAQRILERAARQPDCDQLTLMVVAVLRAKGGDDLAALALWEPLLSQKDPVLAKYAERDYEKTKKQIVIRAAKTFEERHGRKPANNDDLREPGLMGARVVEAVLETVVVSADGKLEFPRERELDMWFESRTLTGWAHAFRNENKRFPTLDEVLGNEVMPPTRPPAGKRWATRAGKVWIEDIPADESGSSDGE